MPTKRLFNNSPRHSMSQRHGPDSWKRLLVIGTVVGFLLLAWLIFSPTGFLKYYSVKKELDTIRTQNQELAERNKVLQEEIERLQKDQNYIEEVARKEHGLIKKNEIIFKFKEGKKKRH